MSIDLELYDFLDDVLWENFDREYFESLENPIAEDLHVKEGNSTKDKRSRKKSRPNDPVIFEQPPLKKLSTISENDIKRTFSKRFENAINTHDSIELQRTLQAMCSDDFTASMSFPKGNPHGASYLEFSGFRPYADFLHKSFSTKPDNIFLIHDTKYIDISHPSDSSTLNTSSSMSNNTTNRNHTMDNKGVVIVCKFTSIGTKFHTLVAEKNGEKVPDTRAALELHRLAREAANGTLIHNKQLNSYHQADNNITDMKVDHKYNSDNYNTINTIHNTNNNTNNNTINNINSNINNNTINNKNNIIDNTNHNNDNNNSFSTEVNDMNSDALEELQHQLAQSHFVSHEKIMSIQDTLVLPVVFKGPPSKHDRYKKQKKNTIGAYIDHWDFSESSLIRNSDFEYALTKNSDFSESIGCNVNSGLSDTTNRATNNNIIGNNVINYTDWNSGMSGSSSDKTDGPVTENTITSSNKISDHLNKTVPYVKTEENSTFPCHSAHIASTPTTGSSIRPIQTKSKFGTDEMRIVGTETTFGHSEPLPVPVRSYLYGVIKMYVNSNNLIYNKEVLIAFKHM